MDKQTWLSNCFQVGIGDSRTRDRERKINALDNFRHTSRPLAFGDGEFVHAGRVHPYITGARHRGRPDQRNIGPTACIAIETRRALPFSVSYRAAILLLGTVWSKARARPWMPLAFPVFAPTAVISVSRRPAA